MHRKALRIPARRGMSPTPPSECLWNTPNYWSPQYLTAPLRSWTKCGKIVDASHMTSYVLNLDITKLNCITFLPMYRNDCRLTRCKWNCYIPIRFRTPFWQKNVDCQIAAELRHVFHILSLFSSEVTGLIFIKILHDVTALSPLFIHT